MKIEKPIINWNGKLTPLNRNNIDGISIHHAAHPSWSFLQIHNFHRDTRGWAGCAYGWVIEKDGRVIAGREFNMNAGVLSHNDHLLSICFAGDYDNQTMPDAQFKAGVELLKWLKKEVPTAKIIDGHKRWQSTSCPGKNFPLQRMINEANNIDTSNTNISSPSTALRQGDKGDSVKELQSKLIKLGYDLGQWGADGDFGNATNIAIKKFQQDNNLTVDGIVGNQTMTKINELIELKNKPIEKPKEQPKPDPKELEKNYIPEYKLEGLKKLHANGFVMDYEIWKNKLDENMPIWTALLIMSRIYDALKDKK